MATEVAFDELCHFLDDVSCHRCVTGYPYPEEMKAETVIAVLNKKGVKLPAASRGGFCKGFG